MKMRSRGRFASHVGKPKAAAWWLTPAFLIVMNLAIGFVALMQSGTSYVVEYRSRKWIDVIYVAICCIFLLFFAIGAWFGRNGYKARNKSKRRAPRSLNRERMTTAFFVVTTICVLAYLIWYINFARLYGAGSFLYVFSPSALASKTHLFHSESGSISGITTFTEFGIVSAVLGAILLSYEEVSTLNKNRIKRLLVLLVFLACLRAILFSERLAILELVVPFAIARFGASRKPLTFIERWIPLIAIVILIFVFGLFEYSRSWLTYYNDYYDSFWDFIFARIFGYYTNAANVESMYIQNGTTSWLPFYSTQWLWQMPGMRSFYSAIADPDIGALYGRLLSTLANPELNNTGGVLTFYKDFAWLGLLPEFMFGYLVGRSYEGYRDGDPFHLMMYSVFFLTLIELPRYFFLGVNRGFVVMVGVCVVVMVCGTKAAESQGFSFNEGAIRD